MRSLILFLYGTFGSLFQPRSVYEDSYQLPATAQLGGENPRSTNEWSLYSNVVQRESDTSTHISLLEAKSILIEKKNNLSYTLFTL